MTSMVFYDFGLLLLLLLVLGYASQRFVSYLTRISGILRFPKFVLSFVVLGLGTSLPDLFVAAFASTQHQAELVVGSVIGANIIVLCLVLGVVTVRKGRFKVRESTVIDNFGWILFVLLIPFFLLQDGKLTPVDGLILVVIYVMYLYNIREQESLAMREKELHEAAAVNRLPAFYIEQKPVLQARKAAAQVQKPAHHDEDSAGRHRRLFLVAKAVFFFAIILVSSNLVVGQSIILLKSFALPAAMFGFSFLALGLALPEFAVDLSALKAREEEVVWGDIIGSFVTELTLVLGVAALASPVLSFDFSRMILAYAFMVAVFLLVFFFAYQKKELSRAEGAALIILYLVFLSIQLDIFLHSA